MSAPSDARNLPVMVWFHGGAYVSGGGEAPKYDGDLLAREGVVVVSVTYRLVGFGYLAPAGFSDCNLGLRDQAEAVKWVAAKVDRFGGDPANVTLFGQSAGADSFLSLMGCADVRGLFRRAIVQSAPLGLRSGRAKLHEIACSAFSERLGAEGEARWRRWLDVVTKLWTEVGPFDFDGDFFHLEGVHSDPKPLTGRVPVLNAGASPQGRAFAAKNADFLFTPVQDFDNAAATVTDVRAAAEKNDRSIGVLTLSHVVCRPTELEALDYLEYYADTNADWQAVDNLMALQGMHAQSFSPEMLANFRPRFAAGHGSYPLVGTPDQIADSIEKMAASGLAGTTLAFVDYAAELPYFVDEVLPRLRQRGLRV